MEWQSYPLDQDRSGGPERQTKMLELKKLFQREGEVASTEMHPNSTSIQEIQAEYRACVDEVMRRAGIAG